MSYLFFSFYILFLRLKKIIQLFSMKANVIYWFIIYVFLALKLFRDSLV